MASETRQDAHAVFLDTNFFYDYQGPLYIDWTSELGAATVKVVVTPVVIRELNEHKDVAYRLTRGDRARSTLRWLGELFGDCNEAALKPGATLVGEWRDVTASPPLVPTVNDDLLRSKIRGRKSIVIVWPGSLPRG